MANDVEEKRPETDFFSADEMMFKDLLYILSLSDLDDCYKFNPGIPTKNVRVKFRLWEHGYYWMESDKKVLADEAKNMKQALYTRNGTGLTGFYNDGETKNTKILSFLYKYLLDEYQLIVESDGDNKKIKSLYQQTFTFSNEDELSDFSDSDFLDVCKPKKPFEKRMRINGLQECHGFPFIFYVTENIDINSDCIQLTSRKAISKSLCLWKVLKNGRDIGRGVLSDVDFVGVITLFAEKAKDDIYLVYGCGDVSHKNEPEGAADPDNYTIVKPYY